MSPQQLELYDRIQAFEIDQPNVLLPFSQRLARENHWSWNYAQQVIEEYKKFLFLAIVSGHAVTPSDAIDQVWHLHLTYTHSYWDELCGQVLQKPLHHHPTQGGAQQRDHFWHCYCQTLESYEKFFGDRAPDHIWADPTVRFKRVNNQAGWLPKQLFKSLGQAVWKAAHWLKRSFLIMALLTFGIALSGSSAIAQLALPIRPPFSSGWILLAISSFNPENIQRLLILHPWLTVGIGVSTASFLMAIGLSFVPAFTSSAGVVENPKHDSSVLTALHISAISASLAIVLYVSNQFNLFYVFSFFVWLIILGGVLLLELSFIQFLSSVRASSKGKSLRLMHCDKCRQRLHRLNASIYLSRKEKVAAQMGSVQFEGWHCSTCYPEAKRDSILLYRYVNSSKRFRQCQNCKELTSTQTSSKVLKAATTSSEGRRETLYTCRCCANQEKSIESIPRLSDDVGCACL
ncbi:hypothetical protein H6F67_00435 [Microcoleus sp. FACHB-1515]|nr:hypothetical protein [Microcoleus sp. FACHB-1515]